MDSTDGRLDIVLGTMFSGKTTYVLSEISKFAELNYKILYVNIDFDNRSSNIFSTHNPFFDSHSTHTEKNNIKQNVVMIKTHLLCSLNINLYDLIVIDEAQFFDDLIEFTTKCLDLNKFIIISGLMADSSGLKFGKIIDLIPICTNIKRLHAYCGKCGENKKLRIAIYSKRLIQSKITIDIGSDDKYIPLCREHYYSNESLKCNKIILELPNSIV